MYLGISPSPLSVERVPSAEAHDKFVPINPDSVKEKQKIKPVTPVIEGDFRDPEYLSKGSC